MTEHEQELIRCIREIEKNWEGGDLALAVRVAAEYADVVEEHDS